MNLRWFASGVVGRRPVSPAETYGPPSERHAAARTTCAARGRMTRSSARKIASSNPPGVEPDDYRAPEPAQVHGRSGVMPRRPDPKPSFPSRWLLPLDAPGGPVPFDRADTPSHPLLTSARTPWADVLVKVLRPHPGSEQGVALQVQYL